MYVGVYLARLETPWVTSLKQKRGLIKPVVEKIKVRFPVSVARLGGLNAHDWELIGVSAISHDAVWLEGLLNRVGDFVVAHSAASVTESSVEIERW
ncbi:MAG: DUF503 family protein [Trueperaceae bacterium]|nr:DUF503 family protein [Trueperaceae bacterium]